MKFRHEDGREMTLAQVEDIVIQQFGAGNFLEQLAARLAWNCGWCAPKIHQQLMEDAAAIAKIASRLKEWEAAAMVTGSDGEQG